MSLLEKVKIELLKDGYDFKSEFFTDEISVLIDDVFLATLKVMRDKEFDIDFGGNVMARIKADSNIQIIAAMNGYGNGIPLDEISIKEVQ
jgi:hypothetical protein